MQIGIVIFLYNGFYKEKMAKVQLLINRKLFFGYKNYAFTINHAQVLIN